MNDSEILETIEIIRQFRSSKQISASEEKKVIEFLRFADKYGISQIRAADLAIAIAESGTCISFKPIRWLSNIHSTGAPGSLTTLLVPILTAASGFYVPQVSIEGGIAGAIDSLTTIPGYDHGISSKKFIHILRKTRLAQVGHTSSTDYAYSDRILWHLREKTNTKSVPFLIAASLLGKMLSIGVRSGVVDVRVGPAGNVGVDIHDALETAYAIVGTANILGMRVTCVLTDATIPQWNKIGRFEAVLSLWQVLSDPEKYLSNQHVKLCVLLATCACHAAAPVMPLKRWRGKVESALLTGKAKKVFYNSIRAHGADSTALKSLSSLASLRHCIVVDLKDDMYSPDLMKVSSSIKNLRQRIAHEVSDQVGLDLEEAPKTALVYVPPNYEHLEEYIRNIFVDALTGNKRLTPISTQILFFTGCLQIRNIHNDC